MKTLIVTAHPDPESLSNDVARRLAHVLDSEVEIADLAEEGFDPRFTLDDRRTYSSGRVVASDVAIEQRRIDEADHLVLVFPVYWWSMPALLKGGSTASSSTAGRSMSTRSTACVVISAG
nr:NAD(P)H-dependent oxidoreductase [Clavibacter michiganensis]